MEASRQHPSLHEAHQLHAQTISMLSLPCKRGIHISGCERSTFTGKCLLLHYKPVPLPKFMTTVSSHLYIYTEKREKNNQKMMFSKVIVQYPGKMTDGRTRCPERQGKQEEHGNVPNTPLSLKSGCPPKPSDCLLFVRSHRNLTA